MEADLLYSYTGESAERQSRGSGEATHSIQFTTQSGWHLEEWDLLLLMSTVEQKQFKVVPGKYMIILAT